MGQDKVFQNIRWGLITVVMATVTAEDPLFACDFETDDLCGMEQGNDNDFDWTRHSNRTQSDIDSEDRGTGPRGAHVGTYYIYIETSNPRENGDRAYISTPAIQHNGDICVRFHYNMYGEHIGQLVVFSEQQSESNPVWREEGDKGGPWFDGKVTVKDFTENDKVVFLGQAGTGYLGDIAIDDVRIHAGECSACQINNGGCDTLCVKLEEYPHLKCECYHGYRIESDLFKCVDIDECREGNGGCSDTCRNTPGSYQCQCPNGYSLAPNNRTCEGTNDVNQGNPRSGDDFPLVPVVVGVLVPAILLVAIVIVVVLLRRRRQTTEGSESVHYENDPGRNITDREHDKMSPPITEVHSSGGIYEEVAEPDNKQQVPRNGTYDDVTGDPVCRIPQVKEAAPNDASEGNTYKNAAFQGDCRYQGLGPDGNPRHYDTIE